MIEKVYSPPSFLTINESNTNESAQKTPLLNQVAGSVINVKNSDVDFRIAAKELSLLWETKSNPQLVNVSDCGYTTDQSSRFRSLGLAVTAICNLSEDGKTKEKAVDICNMNRRDLSVNIRSDNAMNKRGQAFIHQFIDAETEHDSANYALGLSVGSDMKNNILDPMKVKQFDATWNIRLSQTE